MPTISFHVPTDQVTPCDTALVVLPPPLNLPVVEVAGSCIYQELQQTYGNQQAWYDFDWQNDFDWDNDMTDVANSRNGGLEGFFPLPTDDVENNAPWDWWADDLTPPNLPSYPLDVARAKATIDTTIWYFAPRACITLGLGCGFTDVVPLCDDSVLLPIDEVLEDQIDLSVFPNPATNHVSFTSIEYPMLSIKVFDLTGRLIKEYSNIKEFEFEMPRGNLGNGVYFAQVWFEDGFLSKQIIFQE